MSGANPVVQRGFRSRPVFVSRACRAVAISPPELLRCLSMALRRRDRRKLPRTVNAADDDTASIEPILEAVRQLPLPVDTPDKERLVPVIKAVVAEQISRWWRATNSYSGVLLARGDLTWKMVIHEALMAATFAVAKEDWSEFTAESIAALFEDFDTTMVERGLASDLGAEALHVLRGFIWAAGIERHDPALAARLRGNLADRMASPSPDLDQVAPSPSRRQGPHSIAVLVSEESRPISRNWMP